jgi:hypothetical protein
MTQSARRIEDNEADFPAVQPSRRLSFLRFLFRYPIFLLVFGPPILRPLNAYSGFDTSQAHFDFWSIFQVGWIVSIAAWSILRLAYARSVRIPKQIQTILKYAFFLGLLFVVSATYSPGPAVSAEMSVIYFLMLSCVVAFVVDVYSTPPDWMQCLFHLRLIALILLFAVLVALAIEPSLVLMVLPGAGIRLTGGSIAPMGAIPPIIAIISAYCFVHSLESKIRSAVFFTVGVVAALVTQTRGVEISLFIVLVVLAVSWGKTSKRAAYILISGFMVSVLFAGSVVAVIGGDRIWNKFNRNQDTEGILTASGRTGVWWFVIQSSITNPQGMGYIAGIRKTRRPEYATNLHAQLTNVGGTDNSYMEVLADAGWLAFVLYLTVMIKTFALGRRLEKRQALPSTPGVDSTTRHALRCALLLLLFCLIEGMEGSDFVTPLREMFYLQNVIVAIILGASTSMIVANRFRPNALSS